MTVPPNVRIARLLLAGLEPEAVAAQLADAGEHEALALLNARRDSLALLAEAARRVDHAVAGGAALDRIRDGFDAAARIAPDAGVAAYALGDPDLLRRATAELVGWLQAEGLLGPDRDVLDLGCGTGRVTAAVAPLVRSVVGVDVSAEMIVEARRRHPEIRFEVVDGQRLVRHARECEHPRLRAVPEVVDGRPSPTMTDETRSAQTQYHLILAADAFPYLIQADVAEQHIAEASALLHPGGALAILNLSYRGVDQDRADAARWAATYSFRLTHDGDQPFTLWDGRAFVFLKPAAG